jgi:hypothetical protein
MSDDWIAKLKVMERNDIVNLCINKGMSEFTAKTRSRNRLLEYLLEKHENELSCEEANDSTNNNDSEKRVSSDVKSALSVNDFIQTIQEQFDLPRNECLHHPKLAMILSQQPELLNVMKMAEDLQNNKICDLLDDLCFDEEDRKYLPAMAPYTAAGKENVLILLSQHQQTIVSQLEYIVSRRLMKFQNANVNFKVDKDLALKEQLLQRLCALEQKKRQFIETTLLQANIRHPIFVEAKLILQNRSSRQ